MTVALRHPLRRALAGGSADRRRQFGFDQLLQRRGEDVAQRRRQRRSDVDNDASVPARRAARSDRANSWVVIVHALVGLVASENRTMTTLTPTMPAASYTTGSDLFDFFPNEPRTDRFAYNFLRTSGGDQMTTNSSTQHAYSRIRDAIVEGAFPPGQRLVEQRVSADLDLSRTPVREALRMLEAEGLVTTEPNRGATVRAFSVHEVADLYQLRARMESYAAELAAERATPEQLAAIESAADDFEAAAADRRGSPLDRIRRINEVNERLHEAVLAASCHDRLARLQQRTIDVPLVFLSFREFGDLELQRSSLFHRLIADAIAAREPARAGRLMTEHVLQGRDVLTASLTGRAELSDDGDETAGRYDLE